MWHTGLVVPGIQSASPALAGGFSTTGPPGKPDLSIVPSPIPVSMPLADGSGHHGACRLELSDAVRQGWDAFFSLWFPTLCLGQPVFLASSWWNGPAMVESSLLRPCYASTENTPRLWYQVASVVCFPLASPLCLSLIRDLLSRGFWSRDGQIRLDQISCSVVSDSLRPHESQHARPPCPSPTPGVHSDSRPSSQ